MSADWARTYTCLACGKQKVSYEVRETCEPCVIDNTMDEEDQETLQTAEEIEQYDYTENDQ